MLHVAWLRMLCFAVAFLPAAGWAQDGSIGAFYRGRTITLLIGYDVGGGYDLYARLAAQHLRHHLSGNPTIVPKNLPGGGSLALANQLYNTLPRDGTVIGVIGNSLPLDQLLGAQQIMFDAAKFNWIGRLDDLSLLLLSWKSSGIATTQDVLTRSFSIAVPGRGSTAEFSLSAMSRLLGTKYKLISGYRSGQETKLAMERGEVDATASVQWSMVKIANRDWLDQGKINILVQLGLERMSDLPTIPLAPELASTPEQRRILELLMLPSIIGRALLAPPGVPEDRIAALRKAFDAMVSDPMLVSEAERLGLVLTPLPGAALQETVLRMKAIEPDLLQKAKALLAPP